MKALLARRFPRIPPGSADDILQNALVRVLKAVRREGNRDITPYYLMRALRWTVIDEVRSWVRRPESPIEKAPPPLTNDPPLEDLVEGRETREALRGCLGGLIPPRRRAVVLYLLGHTVAEIARLTGWGGRRAENLVYRGLDDLRRCLRERGVRDVDEKT